MSPKALLFWILILLINISFVYQSQDISNQTQLLTPQLMVDFDCAEQETDEEYDQAVTANHSFRLSAGVNRFTNHVLAKQHFSSLINAIRGPPLF